MLKFTYRCDFKDCTEKVIQDNPTLPENWVEINFDVVQREVRKHTSHLCQTHRDALKIQPDGVPSKSIGDELVTVLRRINAGE